MKTPDLTKYGITGTKEIIYNPSYELLFKDEMDPSLTGYEKGQLSELDAVNVMTGIYTGRSPKDKFLVVDENSKNTVWWTTDEYKNDNHPASEETWKEVKKIALNELSNKKLYVVDAYCGANKDTRMAVRFIMEVAWQAHFVRNMFIKPTDEEIETFEPNFVVYTASLAKVDNYKELGLNSETAVMFNITSREQVILNTWYGGEMKKGMLVLAIFSNHLSQSARIFQFSIKIKDICQLFFRIVIQYIGSRFSCTIIHSHIQWSIKTERETTRLIIKMMT